MNVFQCLTQGLRPGLCRSIALTGLTYAMEYTPPNKYDVLTKVSVRTNKRPLHNTALAALFSTFRLGHLTRTQKGTALKVSAIPNIISEQNRLLNAGPIIFRQFRFYLRLNIVSKVREEVNACTTFKFVNANS